MKNLSSIIRMVVICSLEHLTVVIFISTSFGTVEFVHFRAE
jgi:hypothetical protein